MTSSDATTSGLRPNSAVITVCHCMQAAMQHTLQLRDAATGKMHHVHMLQQFASIVGKLPTSPLILRMFGGKSCTAGVSLREVSLRTQVLACKTQKARSVHSLMSAAERHIRHVHMLCDWYYKQASFVCMQHNIHASCAVPKATKNARICEQVMLCLECHVTFAVQLTRQRKYVAHRLC